MDESLDVSDVRSVGLLAGAVLTGQLVSRRARRFSPSDGHDGNTLSEGVVGGGDVLLNRPIRRCIGLLEHVTSCVDSDMPTVGRASVVVHWTSR